MQLCNASQPAGVRVRCGTLCDLRAEKSLYISAVAHLLLGFHPTDAAKQARQGAAPVLHKALSAAKTFL